MKADFDLIVHKFDKPITIYPIADIHYGAINHQKAEWDSFIHRIEKEENAYLILNGDLINNNTRSSVGSPFDDFVRPREQKARMVEYLEPIKDRILCIVPGNHENRSTKDADDEPAYDIACKLDIEDVYRRNAAFLKIGIGEHNKGRGITSPYATYIFAVTHGSGGGIYTGSTVNRNERWGNVIDGIDCVIVGHTHKGTITRPSKLVVDPRTNKVEIRNYLVVSCVAWQAYGEYALQKMLLPSASAQPQRLLLEESSKRISVLW